MPLILALGRQRRVDLGEFEVSLVYSLSSRMAKSTQGNPVSTPLPYEKGKKEETEHPNLSFLSNTLDLGCYKLVMLI